MKFLYNNIELNVQIAPNFQETLDETLDNGQLTIYSTTSTTYKRGKDLKIIFNDESSVLMTILSDQVSLQGRNPTIYQHIISFIQKVRNLSHFQVRNTNLFQPAKRLLQGQFNKWYEVHTDFPRDTGTAPSDYTENLYLSARKKVRNAYVEVNIFGLANTETMQRISVPSLTFNIKRGSTTIKSVSATQSGKIYFTSQEIANLTTGTYTISDVAMTTSSSFTTRTDFVYNSLCIKLVFDTYYYTLLDIITELRTRTMIDGTAKFELPSSTSDFYSTLQSTIAPNFSFTQNTLYECLSQVCLFLDGTPIIDADNKLAIEYFNDAKEEITINSDNITDEKITLAEDRYVNGIISDYQKGILEHSLTFPSKNGFAYVQSSNLGTPIQEDYIMRTDYPIYEIEKVEVYVENYSFRYYSSLAPSTINEVAITINDFVDITNYVVNNENYSDLDYIASASVGSAVARTKNQANCFIWNSGSNEIKVAGTYSAWFSGTDYISKILLRSALLREYNLYDSNYSNTDLLPLIPYALKYRITYKPVRDGKVKIESPNDKFNGEIRLDQASGYIDLTKIGSNLFGTALKLGNEEKHISYKIPSFANRIKKGKVWVDENNERWVVDAVNTTYFSDYVLQDIRFTKDYNKLSNYINLNENKRFNNIDNSIIQKSEDIYCDYIYFSTTNMSDETSSIIIHSNIINEGIKATLSNYSATDSITYATFSATNNGIKIPANPNNLYIPLIKYGSGNALCFEMSYEHPIMAMSSLNANEYYGRNYFSKAVLYADSEGFCDYVDINFYNGNLTQYPLIQGSLNSVRGNLNLQYLKKGNEIFALNYEIICLPYNNEQFFFGENFIKNNGVLGFNNGDCYIYTSTTEKYSILDKKALGSQYGNATITATNLYDGVSLLVYHYSYDLGVYTGNTLKSWCICDKDQNILIAVNHNLLSGEHFKFYTLGRHSRIGNVVYPEVFYGITYNDYNEHLESAIPSRVGSRSVANCEMTCEEGFEVSNITKESGTGTLSSVSIDDNGKGHCSLSAVSSDIVLKVESIASTYYHRFVIGEGIAKAFVRNNATATYTEITETTLISGANKVFSYYVREEDIEEGYVYNGAIFPDIDTKTTDKIRSSTAEYTDIKGDIEYWNINYASTSEIIAEASANKYRKGNYTTTITLTAPVGYQISNLEKTMGTANVVVGQLSQRVVAFNVSNGTSDITMSYTCVEASAYTISYTGSHYSETASGTKPTSITQGQSVNVDVSADNGYRFNTNNPPTATNGTISNIAYNVGNNKLSFTLSNVSANTTIGISTEQITYTYYFRFMYGTGISSVYYSIDNGVSYNIASHGGIYSITTTNSSSGTVLFYASPQTGYSYQYDSESRHSSISASSLDNTNPTTNVISGTIKSYSVSYLGSHINRAVPTTINYGASITCYVEADSGYNITQVGQPTISGTVSGITGLGTGQVSFTLSNVISSTSIGITTEIGSYTLTRNYVEFVSGDILDTASSTIDAGTTINPTDYIRSFSGYRMVSYTPSSPFILNTNKTIIYSYEEDTPTVYHTLTLNYVEQRSGDIIDTATVEIAHGTTVSPNTYKRTISGYTFVSMSPSSNFSMQSDNTIIYSYDEDKEWRPTGSESNQYSINIDYDTGIVGGDTTKFSYTIAREDEHYIFGSATCTDTADISITPTAKWVYKRTEIDVYGTDAYAVFERYVYE